MAASIVSIKNPSVQADGSGYKASLKTGDTLVLKESELSLLPLDNLNLVSWSITTNAPSDAVKINGLTVRILKSGTYDVTVKATDVILKVLAASTTLKITTQPKSVTDTLSISHGLSETMKVSLRMSGTSDTKNGLRVSWTPFIRVFAKRISDSFGLRVSWDSRVNILNRVIMNTNGNSVKLAGYPLYSEAIKVSNGLNIVDKKFFNIGFNHGVNIEAGGYMVQSQDITIYHKQKTVNMLGIQGYADDLLVSVNTDTDITTGQTLNVSGGATKNLYGWRLFTFDESVSTGTSTDISPGLTVIESEPLDISMSAKADFTGHIPGDIMISHRVVTSLFRGTQVESEDIIIHNPAESVLTGTSLGGSMTDVGVPFYIFYVSMDVSKEFVNGQIQEIPQISLDSSIIFGVKLYSSENTLVNPNTFVSASFTFDDMEFPANLDAKRGVISLLMNPDDMLPMFSGMYSVSLHVVDKAGNPSILFNRNVRFI